MLAELQRYQRGEIPFDDFARLTHKTWVAFSVHLLGRWKAPPAVAPEDLQQELLVTCWRCVPKWEADKAPLLKFVVYNCMDKAKKWLHKQRNAYRRDDKSPGRFPIALASLGLEPYAEERLLGCLANDCDQEFAMIRRETILSVERDDLAFIHYQRAGSVERAADAIQASPLARFTLRTFSTESARAVVETAIERAATAIATAAA